LLYFHLNELPRPETGLLVLRRLKPPLSAGPGAKRARIRIWIPFHRPRQGARICGFWGAYLFI